MNPKQKKISSARASTEGNRDGLTWNTALHSKEKSKMKGIYCILHKCTLEATKKK